MGCVSSKQAVSVTPAFEQLSGTVENSGWSRVGSVESDRKCVGSARKGNAESLSFRLGNLQKYVDGGGVDHVAAAGWPAWLSAVAGEAIHGWVPLRADSYEKLEKIGQGTYSSVFRAKDLETGRIVALKKVRFDNFEPESVRFMAREIAILRRLDHQNVIKLDGLITSRLSCSLYLVFEYMEHDITGLLSCPDVKFTDSQIKCYMKQLLSGLQHCHSRGVMHRDIKGSNLLVSNDGTLKVADFGLANFYNSGPLTSRVVTLWYRPPELLLGSTEYTASVDLWSVGCVFAELLLGKPILQGRTEVEQLHKIFKLRGSPPDEYWKRSKLPHATLFRPQQPYDSCLRETFKEFPKECVDLLESLLSVEPYKRGTASSALSSEYFSTKPYACDPSSLPVYPPSKEIDAKNREEAKRKKSNGRSRTNETRKSLGVSKFAQDSAAQTQEPQKSNGDHVYIQKEESGVGIVPTASTNKEREEEREEGNEEEEERLHVKNASQGDIPFSGPLQVSTSSGFAWAKRRKDEAASRSHTRSISRGNIFNPVEHCVALKKHEFRGNDSYEIAVQNQWGRFERPDSFDASDAYHSQDLSLGLYQRNGLGTTRSDRGFQDKSEKVEFSGPLLSQSNRIDELLERHERQIRRAVRKSWFNRGKKSGK